MTEEEALLVTLSRLRSGPLQPGALSGEPVVVTGSGFSGATRRAIRELAALAGFCYSGDLARGRTTHLVLLRSSRITPAASESAAATALLSEAGAASRKRECARLWGIPCVRLAWLLDSCETGQALPVQPYLEFASSGQQSAEAAWAQEQPGEALPHSCRQLTQRARPSSVASNVLGAVLAEGPQQAGHGNSIVSLAHERPWQQHPVKQPPPTGRAALAPVANVLADQLRHMSISPEPAGSPEAAGQPSQHRQQPQLQRPLQLTDSPPLQRSPSLLSSPQHSLSLQGLVGPAENGSQADNTAAAATAARHISVDSTLRHEPSSPQLPHAHATGADSSMQDSPAEGALPFRFSSGRSRADNLPGGSPMVESPAMGLLPSHSSSATEASMQRPCSRLASTPAAKDSPQPMCTPACVRDWSDDDSLEASPTPTHGQCMEEGGRKSGRSGVQHHLHLYKSTAQCQLHLRRAMVL